MILLAILLATTPGCGGSRPGNCGTVGELVDHGLPERLRQFFDDRRSRYVNEPLRLDWNLLINPPWRQRPVADEALTIFSGPAANRVAVRGGYFFFSACRPAMCSEKAGLIVDGRGKVMAVAIVHYRAGSADTPHLAIYAQEGLAQSFIAYLTRWARQAVAPRQIARRIVTRV